MRVAIDANRYTDFCRGLAEAQDILSRAEEIWVPFVVTAELRAGFRAGTRRVENERKFQMFLNSPRVGMIWADEATTHIYAELFADLRRAGTPIPTNDIWIAGVAIQHGLTLFTRDRHFDRIARLAKV